VKKFTCVEIRVPNSDCVKGVTRCVLQKQLNQEIRILTLKLIHKREKLVNFKTRAFYFSLVLCAEDIFVLENCPGLAIIHLDFIFTFIVLFEKKTHLYHLLP
jgi:hypothetical protein